MVDELEVVDTLAEMEMLEVADIFVKLEVADK